MMAESASGDAVNPSVTMRSASVVSDGIGRAFARLRWGGAPAGARQLAQASALASGWSTRATTAMGAESPARKPIFRMRR